VADLTWGIGRFWKWQPKAEVIAFDADSATSATAIADCRHVPLKDGSVDVAVFDPPFIFTPGLRRIIGTKRFFRGSKDNLILNAKGPADLMSLTESTALEMRRVATRGMILKGQNLVVGTGFGKSVFWWTACVWQTLLARLGLEPDDELIQVSKAARLHDPRWKNQYHFRRRHAYYLVYKW